MRERFLTACLMLTAALFIITFMWDHDNAPTSLRPLFVATSVLIPTGAHTTPGAARTRRIVSAVKAHRFSSNTGDPPGLEHHSPLREQFRAADNSNNNDDGDADKHGFFLSLGKKAATSTLALSFMLSSLGGMPLLASAEADPSSPASMSAVPMVAVDKRSGGYPSLALPPLLYLKNELFAVSSFAPPVAVQQERHEASPQQQTLLLKSFAAVAQKDSSAEIYLTKCVNVWTRDKLPLEELGGLHVARGDVRTANKDFVGGIEDYSLAIKIYEQLLGKSMLVELPEEAQQIRVAPVEVQAQQAEQAQQKGEQEEQAQEGERLQELQEIERQQQQMQAELSNAYTLRGKLQMQFGHWIEAERDFSQALGYLTERMMDQDPYLYKDRATCRDHLRQFEGAANDHFMALDVFREQKKSYEEIISAFLGSVDLFGSGNEEDGVVQFFRFFATVASLPPNTLEPEKELELEKKDAELHLIYAAYLYKSDKPIEAQQMWNSGVSRLERYVNCAKMQGKPLSFSKVRTTLPPISSRKKVFVKPDTSQDTSQNKGTVQKKNRNRNRNQKPDRVDVDISSLYGNRFTEREYTSRSFLKAAYPLWPIKVVNMLVEYGESTNVDAGDAPMFADPAVSD